jgi:hypothetical protein
VRFIPKFLPEPFLDKPADNQLTAATSNGFCSGPRRPIHHNAVMMLVETAANESPEQVTMSMSSMIWNIAIRL